jgi:site-specific recombinase XerD
MRREEYALGSTFSDDIVSFLEFKEGIGISCQSRDWYLRDFDAYCINCGATEFDRETVEGWVMDVAATHTSKNRPWLSFIRDFGRYLQRAGRPDAHVLSDDFRSKFTRPVPYLLSEAEIEAFFAVAATPWKRSPLEWEATCLFGLMHSCGLRTCEVLRLAPGDVDVCGGTIDIRWSKGQRSRRLYVTDEVADMMGICGMRNDEVFGKERSSFFVNSAGRPFTNKAIASAFTKIWDTAGLPRQKGKKAPSPYAFRHHFAFANVERRCAEGRDALAALVHLSQYMGHAKYDSTLYYINASPDFMAAYAGKAHTSESLLPEVRPHG